MLRYKDVTEEGVSIEQITTRPTLYLDQWMWCLLSENSKLRKTFIEIGKKVNASIMYSVVTFVELASLEDEKQIEAITEVMQSLDYGFTEANPSRVILREQKLEIPEGGAFIHLNPCCDVELIRDFFLNVMDPLKPFRISSILTQLREEGTSGRYKEMGQRLGSITQIVIKARKDPAVIARAKKRHLKKELQRKRSPYTQDIYNLALDFSVVNETMKMTSAEWMDLLHTIVPVAYMDFVLLDKRWCHFIRRVLPLTYPDIAQVFSQRELDDFLTALSSFNPS